MSNVCSAFGHREVYQNIELKLDAIIGELIVNKGVSTFFTGGMGDFDKLFSSSVRRAQKINSDIKLILVKPYLSAEINDHKSYYKNLYNSIMIPEELCNAHYKSSITKRNKWMIDNSDYVITYVFRNFGGAYSAMRHAQEKGKLYMNIADNKTASSK